LLLLFILGPASIRKEAELDALLAADSGSDEDDIAAGDAVTPDTSVGTLARGPPALEVVPSLGAAPGLTLRVLAAPFTVAKLDAGSRCQREAAAALFAAVLANDSNGLSDGGPHAGGPLDGDGELSGELSSGGVDTPVFIAATSAEISVVAPSRALLHLGCEGNFADERTPPVLDGGWRCLEVAGPTAFAGVGVLARLSECLAAANVTLLAQSTFDTVYLCVKAEKLQAAIQALRNDGHRAL
jgi:hypothetical protein